MLNQAPKLHSSVLDELLPNFGLFLEGDDTKKGHHQRKQSREFVACMFSYKLSEMLHHWMFS